jgi:outer membrane biosynthesis protein TonB
MAKAKTFKVRMQAKPRSEADLRKLVYSYFKEHKKAAKTVRFVSRKYIEIDGEPYEAELRQSKLPIFWTYTLLMEPSTKAAPESKTEKSVKPEKQPEGKPVKGETTKAKPAEPKEEAKPAGSKLAEKPETEEKAESKPAAADTQPARMTPEEEAKTAAASGAENGGKAEKVESEAGQ